MLQRRLGDGLHRPGDRFLSNRAVADQYHISYQTAQRLLSELVAGNLLIRRRGAGTYLPGGEERLRGVQLLFHVRAKRRGSFGAKLLSQTRSRLSRLGIETTVRLIDPVRGKPVSSSASLLPVIWELPAAVEKCATERKYAVVLNDRPASGFASTHIDSVSVDDFTGGACAAQMLASSNRVSIFAGPESDVRSRQRVAGFLSIRRARVVHAGGWYIEDGLAHCAELLAGKPDGVFCCNDRLAEALLRHLPSSQSARPEIVGFDDAPVAAELNLNTIAIPWAELVGAAVRVISSRLSGDRSAAIRLVVAPQPIRRH